MIVERVCLILGEAAITRPAAAEVTHRTRISLFRYDEYSSDSSDHPDHRHRDHSHDHRRHHHSSHVGNGEWIHL